MKRCALKDLRSSGTGRVLMAILMFAMIHCVGCSGPGNRGTNKSANNVGIANPASVNCIDKGGTLSIRKGGDGGEHGICIFADNRQCEEWALFRGECPAGGIKITGYVTPAAQFCAVTGGSYRIDAQSNTDQEQGTCTFTNGKSCDARDYYNGKCSKNR